VGVYSVRRLRGLTQLVVIRVYMGKGFVYSDYRVVVKLSAALI